MSSRLAVLRAVAEALGASRTEREVADAVLHGVGTHLGAVSAALWLLTEDGEHLALSHERNADPEAVSRFARIPVAAELPGPIVLRTQEAQFITSREERDALWPAIAGTPSPSEALAVLPLLAVGEALGVVSFGFPDVREFAAEDRLALLAVADQCAIALDRARLYQAIRTDADTNHLLAQVSAAGGGHDWQAVAQQIAIACADSFVDTCVIYVREGSVVRRVGAKSRSHAEVFADLVDRFPTPLSAQGPTATAIRTGKPFHLPPLDEAVYAGVSQSPAYIERVREIRFGDGWVLPLLDGTKAFGAITLAVAVGEVMSDGALDVGRQIADRTAVLLRSATEYGQQRAALEAIHAVLLPAETPTLRGMSFAASYVPFTAGHSVGGDWWDVLPLRDGRVAMSVGDVAGHGISAVEVMGQLRNAMRGRLFAGVDPATVLGELSAYLDWTHPDAHATGIAMVADPETGELTWASAGHPPPLIATDSDEVFYLDAAPGPPLGVTEALARQHYENHTDTLAPGALIHLYSDGLIEGRHRPLDVGLDLLADTVRGHPAKGLQAHCDQLVATIIDALEDDVCLFIARRSDTDE